MARRPSWERRHPECGEAVGVLPFIDDDHVVLVRQYHYVFDGPIAGDADRRRQAWTNRWKIAARRECREEVGYDAATLQHVSTYFSSKSIVQEICHPLHRPQGLTQVRVVPDRRNFWKVAVFPFDEVYQMVIDSEIRDSMTMIAVVRRGCETKTVLLKAGLTVFPKDARLRKSPGQQTRLTPTVAGQS